MPATGSRVQIPGNGVAWVMSHEESARRALPRTPEARAIRRENRGSFDGAGARARARAAPAANSQARGRGL